MSTSTSWFPTFTKDHMTSSNDLAKAMKNVLDDNGDLAAVRAQLEEQIVLEGNNTATSIVTKPAMPPEIILANNLIRQYLEYVGLHKTSAALCAESGLPDTPVANNLLRSTMSSVQQSEDRPLLQCMIGNLLTD